jgi:hypothetical protein
MLKASNPSLSMMSSAARSAADLEMSALLGRPMNFAATCFHAYHPDVSAMLGTLVNNALI